jgi:hypothetical protein
LNEATKYYADVQNRARQLRNSQPKPVPVVVPDTGADPDPEKKEGGGETPPTAPSEMPPPVGDWNVTALLDVSNSENIESLIATGYLEEAQAGLRDWEREFPLSKVSGDFLIIESKYFAKVGDWKRVRTLLEAYCREMDASSFLPEAARLLIESVKQLKTPPAEIRDVIEKVQGSLKFHPVAEELEAYLSETE